jgi:hypothetical protein
MKKEQILLLIVIALSGSLSLALLALFFEQGAGAQGHENRKIVTAAGIRIVDSEGRTRIKLSDSTIEILDPFGQVVWQAPPYAGWAENAIGNLEPYTGVGGSHWVQTVLQEGRMIILEDGSRWEVEELNQMETVLWVPTSPITVTEAESPTGDFRYVLTNTEAEVSVRALYRGTGNR